MPSLRESCILFDTVCSSIDKDHYTEVLSASTDQCQYICINSFLVLHCPVFKTVPVHHMYKYYDYTLPHVH